jgi:hypothetical protein
VGGQYSIVPFYDVIKEALLLLTCRSHAPVKVVAAAKRPPSLIEVTVCTKVLAIDILRLDIDLMNASPPCVPDSMFLYNDGKVVEGYIN